MSGYSSPRALEMAVKEAAKRSPMDTNRSIAGFYFHRLLCRIFSEATSPFVLKGGLSALARTMDARHTRDIDLATSSLDIDAAVSELKLLASKGLDDYVSFSYVGLNPIKAEDEYRKGYTLTFDAFLGAKRIQAVSVDLVADEIEYGEPDVVFPVDRLNIPGLDSCAYPVYPAEKAVADKVCGIMERHGGKPSSRVKDLVDIVVYAQIVAFDFTTLKGALKKELLVRKLVNQGAFGVPPEWDEPQARQFEKLVKQTGMPDRYHDIHDAESLAKRLIDPCLLEQSDLKVWNTETQAWL